VGVFLLWVDALGCYYVSRRKGKLFMAEAAGNNGHLIAYFKRIDRKNKLKGHQ